MSARIARCRCYSVVILSLVLAACSGVPSGVTPVIPFELERYMGKWYEIARLDHPFERGLKAISAEYALREDGTVSVLNRGYDVERQRWREAEGRARFAGEAGVGHLEVSFFGPFYASYVVFAMPEPYGLAYVTGYDRDYLWLLSRTPEISDAQREAFVAAVRSLGYAADELIWVDQTPVPALTGAQ